MLLHYVLRVTKLKCDVLGNLLEDLKQANSKLIQTLIILSKLKVAKHVRKHLYQVLLAYFFLEEGLGHHFVDGEHHHKAAFQIRNSYLLYVATLLSQVDLYPSVKLTVH